LNIWFSLTVILVPILLFSLSLDLKVFLKREQSSCGNVQYQFNIVQWAYNETLWVIFIIFIFYEVKIPL